MKDPEQSDYVSSRVNKLRLSSRLPLPLPPQNSTSSHHDSTLDSSCEQNYMNREEAFLAPDAQYEMIQQDTCYGCCPTKLEENVHDTPVNYSFYRNTDNQKIPNRESPLKLMDDEQEINLYLSSPEKMNEDLLQKNQNEKKENKSYSNSSTDPEVDWQNMEQQFKSDDGVCPINV